MGQKKVPDTTLDPSHNSHISHSTSIFHEDRFFHMYILPTKPISWNQAEKLIQKSNEGHARSKSYKVRRMSISNSFTRSNA